MRQVEFQIVPGPVKSIVAEMVDSEQKHYVRLGATLPDIKLVMYDRIGTEITWSTRDSLPKAYCDAHYSSSDQHPIEDFVSIRLRTVAPSVSIFLAFAVNS